MTNRLCRH
uniref:Uncharacterized protein n=1 Tax=Arundo donax TaxID=35708 RepID=A0A0A9C7V5_ARUDO